MVWKDENGNTCFGVKPEPPVAETSEDNGSGAVETPPRKRKPQEEKPNEKEQTK